MRVFWMTKEKAGCLYYRCSLPAKFLALAGHEVRIQPEIWQQDIEWADVVVFHKPWRKEFLKVYDLVHENDAKVVYDCDDDLLHIPEWNPGHKYWGQRKEMVETLIREADAVSVSTERLLDCYGQYNGTITLLPNGLDLDLVNEVKEKELDLPKGLRHDSVRIGWLGGRGHGHDLSIVTTPLIELAMNADVQIIMVAGVDSRLFDSLPSDVLVCLDPVPFEQYYDLLWSLKLDIGLAPIEMNEFNLAKSNLKILEYLAFGAAPVCTSFGEYLSFSDGMPGSVWLAKNNSAKEWGYSLMNAMRALEVRARAGRKGQDVLEESFDMKKNIADWIRFYEQVARN